MNVPTRPEGSYPGHSDRAKEKKEIVSVFESLSAISEENASSSEQTSSSAQMQNEKLHELTKITDRLSEMANILKDEIKKFTI